METKSYFIERPIGLIVIIFGVIGIWAFWAWKLPLIVSTIYPPKVKLIEQGKPEVAGKQQADIILQGKPADEVNLTTEGQFGDMFGALNTLFAGLAFAGLIHTVFLQRAEIRDARAEVVKSEKLAESQRFEATLFQLINTFNSIVESLVKHNRFNGGEGHFTQTGRDVLHEDATALTKVLKHKDLYKPPGTSLPREEIIESYDSFYRARETRLAHYFRMLYRILKWIERADETDQLFYAKTIRAQLSSQELVLLFYNCLSKDGAKMKLLVEKYALLKHMPKAHAVSESAEYFDWTAFEDKKTPLT